MHPPSEAGAPHLCLHGSLLRLAGCLPCVALLSSRLHCPSHAACACHCHVMLLSTRAAVFTASVLVCRHRSLVRFGFAGGACLFLGLPCAQPARRSGLLRPPPPSICMAAAQAMDLQDCSPAAKSHGHSHLTAGDDACSWRGMHSWYWRQTSTRIPLEPTPAPFSTPSALPHSLSMAASRAASPCCLAAVPAVHCCGILHRPKQMSLLCATVWWRHAVIRLLCASGGGLQAWTWSCAAGLGVSWMTLSGGSGGMVYACSQEESASILSERSDTAAASSASLQ
jgi:hypothetical protein